MSLFKQDQLGSAPIPASDPIRCAIIGGMVETNFWPELMKRFESATDVKTKVESSGPKRVIAEAFIKEELDLIVMHASDTIINLAADGYGENPQPWARNDLILVGPASDPAKIKGQPDAVEALEMIAQSQNRIVVHASLGANEVLRDLLATRGIRFDSVQMLPFHSEHHREMLKFASAQDAYALVGRIPFLNGKIPNAKLEIMVQGDPRMRRPYVVVVATEKRIGAKRHQAATRLANFLRTPDTQSWIAEFGKGELDDRPLFFPVVLEQE